MPPRSEPSGWLNEIDPFAAAWCRELSKAGHIPPCVVDERSIKDIKGEEVKGYAQCHWFGGIAGWPLALALAGVDPGEPLWTGSCPCQPFSAAGKRKGTQDERHLWPEFLRLIAECRPPVVFGEQVASKDGREWLAGVRADLEALGYAVGAADLCAAGQGAPHIRQRLFWVADAGCGGRDQQRGDARGKDGSGESGRLQPVNGGFALGLADAGEQRRDGREGVEGDRRDEAERGEAGHHAGDHRGCGARRMGDADQVGRCQHLQRDGRPAGGQPAPQRADAHRPIASLRSWERYAVVHCRDGKARRFESGSFPLADGVSARVGRLRGYGNAIIPQVAAAFIVAWMEATGRKAVDDAPAQ